MLFKRVCAEFIYHGKRSQGNGARPMSVGIVSGNEHARPNAGEVDRPTERFGRPPRIDRVVAAVRARIEWVLLASSSASPENDEDNEDDDCGSGQKEKGQQVSAACTILTGIGGNLSAS